MEKSQHKLNEDEINIKEVLQTLYHYRWSILTIIISALLFAYVFLYFKTPIYSSSAIIEVKSSGQQTMQEGDFLGSAFSSFGKEKVDKEIEILKTFNINNHALNKLDFQVQYFIDDGFKKKEIYHNPTLTIKEVIIHDPRILWKMIKITPVKGGYTLQVQNSLKKKIKHKVLGESLIQVDTQKIYPFNKKIKTKYFEFTAENKNELKQPIYINIKGNNRLLYEAIIRQNLEVFQINPAAPLIQVTYKDNIPKRADTYIDTLLESFIEQSVAEKSKKINRIIDFIDHQLKETKKKLDASEQELEEYRIKHKAINSDIQAQTYMKDLSEIEIELNKNKFKKVILEELLNIIKTTNNIDTAAPLLQRLEDQSSLSLMNELQTLQTKALALKNKFSNRYPQVIALNKQIAYLKKRIINNIKRLKSGIQEKNKSLTRLKNKYEEKIKDIPTQERKLINLKRDAEVSSETYNYLLKKKSENEMIKVAILSDYRIIDKAYNNRIPVSPKPFFTFLVAFILGVIFGFLQALFRNFLNDKIQTKADIENLTTLPIYGILPVLKEKVIKLEVFKNPKSPFAESYRSLRTNLQFSRKEKQANVVLVTSTIMGEGKSTTVANLGAIFQMANYRSIVINLDMRKPTLHHYFDVDNNIGMSTYLSGKNTIEEVIQPTSYENLDIIPSGPIPPNPSELIISDKLDALLDNLKEVYDYIFIDSAPLGLVTDTMQLMQYADINLIVFRENYAKKSFVTDLNDLVKKHDLKHIGIILNSVDISSGSHGYGYGYGYGYGDK